MPLLRAAAVRCLQAAAPVAGGSAGASLTTGLPAAVVSLPRAGARPVPEGVAHRSRVAGRSHRAGRAGDPEIWAADASGGNLHRLTNFAGPDVAPTWNPRTNAQLAWVSGRTKLPQIYTMDQDGANVQRLTDSGYAISPSWSPNGQFLTFSWNRKYGPGAPGGVSGAALGGAAGLLLNLPGHRRAVFAARNLLRSKREK